MVRFAKNYAAHLEFNDEDYFNYDLLKKIINAPATSRAGGGNDPEEQFLAMFQDEVNRVNLFYISRLVELEIQVDYLQDVSKRPPSREMEDEEVPLAANAASGVEDEEEDEEEDNNVYELDQPVLTTPRLKSQEISVPGEGGGHSRNRVAVEISTMTLMKNLRQRKQSPPGHRRSEGSFSFKSISTKIHNKMEEIKHDKKTKKIMESSLKRSLTAAFKNLTKLENFRVLNITACIKILKKFDKVNRKAKPTAEDKEPLYPSRMQIPYSRDIGDGDRIADIITRVEHAYAAAFCKDDLGEAHGKLRMSKGEEPQRILLSLGFKFGVFFTLVIWLFAGFILTESGQAYDLWQDPFVYVYSVSSAIIVWRWCWGLCVYFFETAHVNYIVLLEFEASHMPRCEQIFSDTINLTIIFLVNLILYFDAQRASNRLLLGAIPAFVFPVILILIILVRMGYYYVCATEFCGLFSLQTFFNLLSPISHPSSLKDRFAADVLCSFTRTLAWSSYASCYVFSFSFLDNNISSNISKIANSENYGICTSSGMQYAAACLSLLPLVTRLLQCLRRQYDSGAKSVLLWPHSYNSIKYALSILVIVCGSFRPITNQTGIAYSIYFALLCIAATALQTYYDFVVDWGLFHILPEVAYEDEDDNRSGLDMERLLPHRVFLRKRLLYRDIKYYYLVCFLNPVLRCLWTISLLPDATALVGKQLTPFLAAIELGRRFLWATLKIEFDHVRSSADDEELEVEEYKTFVPFHFQPHEERLSDGGSLSHKKRVRFPLALACSLSSAIGLGTYVAFAISK